jgi:hypothetical protein
MKIKLFVAWYDFWIGVFVDRKKRKIYFLPIPCAGVEIDYSNMQIPEREE